jgi:hypothetical protein
LAASRRMDAAHGLAAILRDAREERAPQDEVQDIFTSSEVTTRDLCCQEKTGIADAIPGFYSQRPLVDRLNASFTLVPMIARAGLRGQLCAVGLVAIAAAGRRGLRSGRCSDRASWCW